MKLLLTTKIDVNHVNNLGWTCLLEIVILGDGGARHVEVGKLVLAAGADPNIADKDGVSPLAHARRKGQREIGRLIEAAGGGRGQLAPIGSRRDRPSVCVSQETRSLTKSNARARTAVLSASVSWTPGARPSWPLLKEPLNSLSNMTQWCH